MKESRDRNTAQDRPGKRIYLWLCLAVVLTGAVFAASATAIKVSGTVNLNDFYDVGKIYEVPFDTYCYDGTEWTYDASDRRSHITGDAAFYNVRLLENDFAWRYLKIAVKEKNVPSLNLHIYFFTSGFELVGDKEVVIGEEEQVLYLDSEPFQLMQIHVKEQAGAAFALTKLMLYENAPVFSAELFCRYFAKYFAVYLAVILVLWVLFRKLLLRIHWYAPVAYIQKGHIFIGNAIYKIPFLQKRSSRQRNGIRTFLFWLMFVVTIVFVDLAKYNKAGYDYLLTICCLLMFLIAVFSIEGPLHEQNWRNPLTLFWYVLWIMACISDAIVPKVFHYTGYMMIFLGGFLFLIWGNMKQPSDLLRNMRKAVLYTFPPAVIYCFLFRPRTDGIRYSGLLNNPIPFAIYLTMVLIALYAEILGTLRKQKKWSWINLWYIIEVLAALYFIWKTQSTFAIGTLGLVSVFFLFSAIVYSFGQSKRKLAAYIILSLCLMLPVWYGTDYGVSHISEKFGKEIIYKNDWYKPAVSVKMPWETTVYASDSEENRVMYKVLYSANLEELTSGRTLYQKAYFREMNLFGHTASAKFLGAKHQAHNAVIMIAYRYGVFAAVPYALMMLLFVICAASHLKKAWCDPEVWFLFVIAAAVGLMLMFDNLEQPFRWICWPLYFIGMGYCLNGHTS